MPDFDSVFEDVGVFGRVQRRIFILISLMEAPAAWAMFLPVFIHAVPPDWSCGAGAGNSSYEFSNLNEVTNQSALTTDCKKNAGPSMCLASGETCPDLVFNGSSFTSIVSEWGLVCEHSGIPSLIVTVQMVGVLVGACVCGQLADVWGRRPTMFAAYTLMAGSGVAAAVAPAWQWYCVARTLLGAFFGGTLVINQSMPLEFVGRKWRTFCGCVGAWAVGVMMLAGLAYLIRDWRHLSLATSLLSLLLLPTWWLIPESPRWLIQKGRIQEAQKILQGIAGPNRQAPDADKLQLITQNDEAKKRKNKEFSFWDLCANFHMTRNTAILVYAWFVCSFVYYGVSLNVGSLSGDRYINVFLLGLADLPALAVVIIVNNTLGRRYTLAMLMSLAGGSCFAMLFLDISGKLCELSTLTQVLALLGKSGIAGAWAAAQVFSAELFPTVVRNIGVGTCSMAARLGGVLAPQVILLNEISSTLPYIIFGSLGIVSAVLTFWLPETLNKPLQDTLPQRTYCVSCFRQDSSHSNSVAQDATAPPSPCLHASTHKTPEKTSRSTEVVPLTDSSSPVPPAQAHSKQNCDKAASESEVMNGESGTDVEVRVEGVKPEERALIGGGHAEGGNETNVTVL